MNKTLITVGVIILLVVGWYLFRSAEDMASRTLVVQLEPQNNSGISGTATFTDTAGGAEVVFNLTGTPSGIAQPAHIHLNNCANIGGVKYPLTSPMNGNSVTMLNVGIDQILAELPLSINVHKTSQEASVYVACGNIVAQ